MPLYPLVARGSATPGTPAPGSTDETQAFIHPNGPGLLIHVIQRGQVDADALGIGRRHRRRVPAGTTELSDPNAGLLAESPVPVTPEPSGGSLFARVDGWSVARFSRIRIRSREAG